MKRYSPAGSAGLVGLLVLIFLLGATAPADADVRLPRIFSSHMVLQQEAAIPVWGWASPREKVTVTLGPTSQRTVAGKDEHAIRNVTQGNRRQRFRRIVQRHGDRDRDTLDKLK